MKSIEISASPKQLSRLRNGHRVRVKHAMKGEGVNLLVDPAKFDQMTRSFTKGSAIQMQLTPDEVLANRQAVSEGTMGGEGIFAGGKLKNLLKKVGKVAAPIAKDVAKDVAKEALKEGVKSAVSGTGKKKSLMRRVGRKQIRSVSKELGRVAKNVIDDVLLPEGKKILRERIRDISNPVQVAEAIKAEADKAEIPIAKAELLEGKGIYAGRGMCGGLLGPRSRLPEVSSISVGGSLLGLQHPALASDAASANFHMNTQLPPQFQRGGVRFV